MDFKRVFEFLLNDFKKHDIEYACIGGFALGALGIVRSTIDLDFLVHKKDLATIDTILTSHLYRLIYQSENVSQYVSAIKPLGSIDLLHAFRHHSLTMLGRSQKISIFEGQYEINVVLPEDIIGLKMQAMLNNPERKSLERADIELLVQHFHENLDWQLLAEYFELFRLNEYFETLRARYGDIE